MLWQCDELESELDLQQDDIETGVGADLASSRQGSSQARADLIE